MDVVFGKAGVVEKFAPVVLLGLHHEQQHQELMLADIKHVFFRKSAAARFSQALMTEVRAGLAEALTDVSGRSLPGWLRGRRIPF